MDGCDFSGVTKRSEIDSRATNEIVLSSHGDGMSLLMCERLRNRTDHIQSPSLMDRLLARARRVIMLSLCRLHRMLGLQGGKSPCFNLDNDVAS